MNAEREAEAVVAYLGERARRTFAEMAGNALITDIRLRAGQAPRAAWREGEISFGDALTPETLMKVISAMLEHSLYAWENELGEGYFTLKNGCRAGVSGRYVLSEGKCRLACVSSACVRIARERKGCARVLVKRLLARGAPTSAIILSPPGGGKTTLLRDAARLFSEHGLNVGLADERGELAASRQGVMRLDVGERTDIAEGLPKALAIARLIRSMAPDVIVTDELGAPQDVVAVMEAARMGVSVLASAHAATLAQAAARPMLKHLLAEGVFPLVITLGGAPGNIESIYEYSEGDEYGAQNRAGFGAHGVLGAGGQGARGREY